MIIVKKNEEYEIRYDDNSGTMAIIYWSPTYKSFCLKPLGILTSKELWSIMSFIDKLEKRK